MKVYEFRVSPKEFNRLFNGDKGFDIRKNDVEYNPGDIFVYRPFEDGNYVNVHEYGLLSEREKPNEIVDIAKASSYMAVVKYVDKHQVPDMLVMGIATVIIPSVHREN